MKRPVIAAALLGVLAAAATPARCQSPPAAPPPVRAADPAVLRPGDVLRIGVWPNEDLGGDFIVESSGNVYLPFLGATPVVGTSIEQLRARLHSGYSEVVQNPVVTVFVMFPVGVLGAVRRPGMYQVNGTNTLFDVIGMAGGFDAQADERQVRVVREGEVIVIDAFRTLEDGHGLSALSLRSGDRIVVPVLRGGFNWRTMLTVIQSVGTVVLLVDRLSSR